MNNSLFFVLLIGITSAWLSLPPACAQPSEITANEVFSQAYQIGEELKIMQRHFGLPEQTWEPLPTITMTNGYLYWQSEEILTKIALLRAKFNLPSTAQPGHEPSVTLSTWEIFEQTQRMMTEVKLLKQFLGIVEKPPSPLLFVAKTAQDAYQQLHVLSALLDQLRATPLPLENVFAQAMRLMKDVEVILSALQIVDDNSPPLKRPQTSLREVQPVLLNLLREIERLKRSASLPVVDYAPLMPVMRETLSAEMCFHLIGVTLSELQALKAQLGLRHLPTPPAYVYVQKTPAEIHQILEWCTHKLHLVRALSNAAEPVKEQDVPPKTSLLN